jgi:eukaryotic-like serine/threonine-protein kinase
VIGTDPPEGQEVPRNSQVTVLVSKGPQLVSVPNLRGQAVEDASAQLEALGLVADVENFRPGARVRAQDPDTGAQAPRGSKVTLFL